MSDWDHQTTKAAAWALAMGFMAAYTTTVGVFAASENRILGALTICAGLGLLAYFASLIVDYASPRIP